jgi:hypothetical protein
MELRFSDVSKENRKAFVKAVSEAAGLEAVYRGAPGFAFDVGDYTVDRHGTLICDDRVGAETVRGLLAGLAGRGFTFEGDIEEPAPVVSVRGEPAADDRGNREGVPGGGEDDEPPGNAGYGEAGVSEVDGDSGRLVIHMPLSGFTASARENVGKLVAAKAWILKRMAGTDALPVERDERHLRFPWFSPDASAVEIDAYSHLIAGLCETAKAKKRVVAAERRLPEGDSEKFKARCFLLSIGFIGEEYKQARKVLLAPFSGNGSHKAGNGKKASPEAATSAQSDGENAEAVIVREDGSGANNADTGAGNGGYRDCLACANSLSEPAEDEGGFDRLFCAEHRKYVEENGFCDEFNR